MSEEIRFFEREIEWLKTASPDDWHRVALDYNWDEGIETLFWIAQQPQCDRATAVDIFWKGQPAWYLYLALKDGKDEADDPIWAMLQYIAARINARGYPRSMIAFDATPGMRQDYDELAGYAKVMPKPPFQLHRDLLRSARGREIVNDTDFYRRYPFAHSAMIETPALDDAAIDDIPDLVAARSAADSVVINFVGFGFAAMVLVMYPMLVQNISALTIGLAGLSWGAYATFTEFRDMNGLLRANRLTLKPGYILATLGLAVLAGAAIAKPMMLFRDWSAPQYGMIAFLAALFAAGALTYLVVGKGLARVLISPNAMREV